MRAANFVTRIFEDGSRVWPLDHRRLRDVMFGVLLSRGVELAKHIVTSAKSFHGRAKSIGFLERVEKLVFFILKNHAGRGEHQVFPLARDPISAMLGIADRAVTRILDRLVEVGVLARRDQKGLHRGFEAGKKRFWYYPGQYSLGPRVAAIFQDSGTGIAPNTTENHFVRDVNPVGVESLSTDAIQSEPELEGSPERLRVPDEYLAAVAPKAPEQPAKAKPRAPKAPAISARALAHPLLHAYQDLGRRLMSARHRGWYEARFRIFVGRVEPGDIDPMPEHWTKGVEAWLDAHWEIARQGLNELMRQYPPPAAESA